MQIAIAQQQVAQQLGLKEVEVELLWALLGNSPEMWRAVKLQAGRIIESEEQILRGSEDLNMILRAQGQIRGIERFLECVEDVAQRVEDLRVEEENGRRG